MLVDLWSPSILAVKKKSHKSINYFNQNSKNYWPDLIEEERPHYLRNDICTRQFGYKRNQQGEIHYRSNPSLRMADDFSSCLLNVLRVYNHTRIRTFILITYSGSMTKKQNDFYCLNLQSIYANDTWPMERSLNI